MKITGEATLTAPVDAVWDALLDPAVLVATLPGCQRLETTGEHAYGMTIAVGVAAVRGSYAGTCTLHDLEPHRSLVMTAEGAGAPGTINTDVRVAFTDNGDGSTGIAYDADAVIGGVLGGVGQRMLTSVSKRMAAEFFNNVERALHEGVPAAAVAEASAGSGETAAAHGVYTAPAAGRGSPDFLAGVATGAGLVLAGVLAGVVLGRRRS